MSEYDLSFPCMGCDFRLLVGEPSRPGLPAPESAARRARALLESIDARLSRFRPDSDLSALNAEPRERVAARPLLLSLAGAARWAGELTGGLVDCTLTGELEAAGYARSMAGAQPLPLWQGLQDAPPRLPAAPRPAGAWRALSVDRRGGTISRPPGLRLDSGGIGKGLGADIVARLLNDYRRYAVDAAGDLAIGGRDALERPYHVEMEHPLTGEHVHAVPVRRGGIATSGINSRIWRRADGSVAHHLLNPATGEPAWTGVLTATALGASALEAETLAKWALLAGPDSARRILARRGGLIVHDDGDVELVGPMSSRRSVLLRRVAA